MKTNSHAWFTWISPHFSANQLISNWQRSHNRRNSENLARSEDKNKMSEFSVEERMIGNAWEWNTQAKRLGNSRIGTVFIWNSTKLLLVVQVVCVVRSGRVSCATQICGLEVFCEIENLYFPLDTEGQVMCRGWYNNSYDLCVHKVDLSERKLWFAVSVTFFLCFAVDENKKGP